MVDLLRAFQDLDQLEGLETSDTCRGRSESWDNPACLQLDRDPVHLGQLVVLSTAVAHAAHEVDVEVGVVVLFKLIGKDKVLLKRFILINWQLRQNLKELILLLFNFVNIDFFLLLLAFLLFLTFLFLLVLFCIVN